MKKKKIVKPIIFLVLLVALVFVVRARVSAKDDDASPESPAVTAPVETEPVYEGDPEYFTLSAIGDCTIAPRQNSADFVNKVNGDFSYPFSNTVQYFNSDEFTIANLECTFSDQKLPYDYTVAMFYFIAGTEYANILTEGGVDFVTTANNHSYDFYQKGVDDTCAALDAIGMPYGIEDQFQIVTSQNGIKFGIYCAYNNFKPDVSKATQAIKQLQAEGADYIICMFHWPSGELIYAPTEEQTETAHACIDAGADLIYGSHTHCLQPIEEYNGGVILYGMGNWSFGGSDMPTDPDTAIVQLTLRRDPDGSVSNDGITAIPCRVSSQAPDPSNTKAYAYNDYRPTPYEDGSAEYERTMSKLLGEYEGGGQPVDYSSWYANLG